MDFGQINLASIASGLMGAIFGQAVRSFIEWKNAPNLKIFFEPEISGCVRDNIEFIDINDPLKTIFKRRYLRAKIVNTGNNNASNVRVMITDIQFCHSTTNFDCEVIDLHWSNAENLTEADIPSKSHRFVDIVSVVHETRHLCIHGTSNLSGLETIRNEAITITLIVAAKNSKTQKKIIRFSYEADAASLQIQPSRCFKLI